jgi:hypothetical protein
LRYLNAKKKWKGDSKGSMITVREWLQ